MMLRRTFLAASLAFASACGAPKEKNTDVRHWTDDLAVRISVNPMPPRAMERIEYKIVVRDKKTNQPIDAGEGRLFATSQDGASTHDGLAKGKEVGTYYARLFFVTSGDWAIALQFRRDASNQRLPLQRMDWIQTVNNPSEPGT